MHGCSRKQRPAVTSKSARSVPVAASARQHTPAATHGQPLGVLKFCFVLCGSFFRMRLQSPASSQVKTLYREYKIQRTAALPPNSSVQGSTAAPGGPAGAGAGAPDDYLLRLAARFEAVAADAADDAARELATVHPVSTSGVAFKLFAHVIGERESALAEEAEKWIRGGMYDTIAANRPDNASSSRDKDRAVQSSQGLAATEAALQWAKPGPQQPPVAAYIVEQFQTRGARPLLVGRSAQTVCQALFLLAFSSLCHHLSAFDAPAFPPTPSPGPESKAGSYSGGCPYPHDSANAATAYNVASWIVIVSHVACVMPFPFPSRPHDCPSWLVLAPRLFSRARRVCVGCPPPPPWLDRLVQKLRLDLFPRRGEPRPRASVGMETRDSDYVAALLGWCQGWVMGHYESDSLVGRAAAESECLPISSVVSTYGVGKGSFTTRPMYELVSYIEKCFAQRLREVMASGHFSSDTMREIASEVESADGVHVLLRRTFSSSFLDGAPAMPAGVPQLLLSRLMHHYLRLRGKDFTRAITVNADRNSSKGAGFRTKIALKHVASAKASSGLGEGKDADVVVDVGTGPTDSNDPANIEAIELQRLVHAGLFDTDEE